VSLLELFAALLLVIGSVLVLWTVIRADVGYARPGRQETGPRAAETDLRRAA
jgi:hypothetical protein